jgi:hypothetical protein
MNSTNSSVSGSLSENEFSDNSANKKHNFLSGSKFEIISICLPIINTYKSSFGDDCSICFNNINIYNPEDIISNQAFIDPKILCNANNIDYNKYKVGECGHVYHKNCINSWLKNNNKCPNCRTIWKLKQ